MKSLLRLSGFAAAMLAAVPLHAGPQVTPSERVKRNVIVRESPDPGSAKLAGLAPGQDALLEGETSGWYRVRLPDGKSAARISGGEAPTAKAAAEANPA